ncbi:response regulator receiver protein [Labilithrix luteola]|uniref:Response regulator receiver protein n=1 Tax=Labilithrix luteola TaxID=1391654 RepID=A0A0K1Q0R8_9BACT|nr:response regulator receiver protein [Labilithrix luteola]
MEGEHPQDGSPRSPAPFDSTDASANGVLIVEDDDELRALVKLVLEESGYGVIAAQNGQDALRLLGEREQRDGAKEPDLILLDMRMPVMNGWEFARRYRENGHHAPIVVLTAAVHAAQFADEIKADGWLSKPFSLNELLDAVKSHLSHSPR